MPTRQVPSLTVLQQEMPQAATTAQSKGTALLAQLAQLEAKRQQDDPQLGSVSRSSRGQVGLNLHGNTTVSTARPAASLDRLLQAVDPAARGSPSSRGFWTGGHGLLPALLFTRGAAALTPGSSMHDMAQGCWLIIDKGLFRSICTLVTAWLCMPGAAARNASTSIKLEAWLAAEGYRLCCC